jgi:hypothetical protein
MLNAASLCFSLVEYEMYLRLFIFIWKNPVWVTDYDRYVEFREDYYTCGSPIDVPVEFGGSCGE